MFTSHYRLFFTILGESITFIPLLLLLLLYILLRSIPIPTATIYPPVYPLFTAMSTSPYSSLRHFHPRL